MVALRGTVRLLPTAGSRNHVSRCATGNLLTGICLAGSKCNVDNSESRRSLGRTTTCTGSIVSGSKHRLLRGCSSIFHLSGGFGRRYLLS